MKTKHFSRVLAVAASALLFAFIPLSCDFMPYEGEDEEEETPAPEEIYDVAAARSMTGSKKVWVCGYIIGNVSPFKAATSATNLAIADTPQQTAKDSCLSVELKIGELRDALNLPSNPGNLGRKVYLKGDITTYYSIPGVKNISAWSLDDPPSKK